MIKTRYEFFKRTHKDYVVIFIKDKNYMVYGEDKEFLMILGRKNLVETLNEFHVNYIIVDELDIVNKNYFKDNQYNVMKWRELILKIVQSCQSNKRLNLVNIQNLFYNIYKNKRSDL